MADHQVEHIQRRIAETWDKHRLAGTALSAAAAAFLVGWGVGNYYASQKRYYANLADLKQTFRLESNNGQGTSIASTARSESRRTTMMDDSPESQKLKMVIVARMDLKMVRPGSTASLVMVIAAVNHDNKEAMISKNMSILHEASSRKASLASF